MVTYLVGEKICSPELLNKSPALFCGKFPKREREKEPLREVTYILKCFLRLCHYELIHGKSSIWGHNVQIG